MGMDVHSCNTDNELGDITHGGEEMASAGLRDGGVRAPKATVQDKYGSGDGPTEKDFTMLMDALVSKNAVCTFFGPIDNILEAPARPEEVHANSEECFVDAKVTANGVAMKDIKDETTQGSQDDDEQEGNAGL
jgi:hypothetical protein